MASSKKIPGSPTSDLDDFIANSDAAPYLWPGDQTRAPQALGATDAQGATENSDPASSTASAPAASTQSAASGTPGAASAQPGVSGTPGADTFALDIATVQAAVAPSHVLAEISGYSAAQGDVIAFADILRGSYAPLTPDTTQLRVTEDASGTFATLDFNAGSAHDPRWTALAKLDGMQLGDAVNVVLDATHTVQLHSAWLA
jgi:hypothetical protein